MLLACSGWCCDRLISVTNIPGGNPVALRDPEHFALRFVVCRDCHSSFCDRCAPGGGLFASARCLLCRGKLADGRHLERVEAGPLAAAVELRDHGDEAAGAGRFDEALRTFDDVLRRRPEYVQAHFDRAAVLDALGRRPEALVALERVIELQPGHVRAMYEIGCIHRARRELAAALAAYDRALALQPRYTMAMVNRATTLFDLERLSEAVETAHQAIDIIDAGRAADRDPSVRAIALGVKGAALLMLRRDAEGLEMIDGAIAAGLDNRHMHLNRAVALAGLGRHDEAADARRTAEQRST